VTEAPRLPHPHAEQMRDHWWWRPGWAVGRRFYTWHLTFDGQDELHQLVRAYQDSLADLRGLDLIPHQWLHLTMQGVGFTDQVSTEAVRRIVTAAAARLRTVDPPRLTFHRLVVLPEALALPPTPAEPLWSIRDAIRAGIGHTWGASNVPEPADQFRPHLSVAYNTEDRPAGPVIDTVEQLQHAPVTVTVDSAALIVLERDERIYRWWTQATVPFASPSNGPPPN